MWMLSWLQWISGIAMILIWIALIVGAVYAQSDRYHERRRQKEAEARKHEFCHLDPCEDCLNETVERTLTFSEKNSVVELIKSQTRRNVAKK